MDILTTLFTILFIIAIPMGEILRIPVGNGTLLPVDVAVFLIALWGLVSMIYQKKKPLFLNEILIFSGVALVSLLANYFTLTTNQFITAGLYLVRWVSYAGVYMAVTSLTHRSQKRVVSLMLASSLLIALFGCVQYVLYPNLRNLAYLGWDVHLYRLFSSFFDPNFTGVFLSLGFFLFLAITLRVRVTNDKKIGLALLMGITMIAIVLTYSRSAYTMVFLGSLGMIFLSKYKKLAVGIGIGSFMLLLAFILIIKPRSEGTNLLRTTSSKARLVSTQNAISIFLHSPVYGIGFNAYRYAQIRFGYLSEKDANSSLAAAGTDNSFLFILATTGLIGFFAYLWLYGKMFVYAWKRRDTLYGLAWIGSFVGLSSTAFVINSLFYPFILVWLWVLGGLIERT